MIACHIGLVNDVDKPELTRYWIPEINQWGTSFAYYLKHEAGVAEQIYGIIHEGRDPYESLRELLSREQKRETL